MLFYKFIDEKERQRSFYRIFMGYILYIIYIQSKVLGESQRENEDGKLWL